MIAPVEAIGPSQLNDQGDGTVTVTIVRPDGIMTGDSGKMRPAKAGDVYSIQADGTVQGRPSGTNGGFERAKRSGSAVVYAPNGHTGIVVIFPFAADLPNG